MTFIIFVQMKIRQGKRKYDWTYANKDIGTTAVRDCGIFPVILVTVEY